MRGLVAALAVAVAVVGGRPVVPAGASPVLSVGPDVNVSRAPSGQAEEAISIDPANPSLIVEASNTDGSRFGLLEAVSRDGGSTWRRRVIRNGGVLGDVCCDPSLSFDAFGNLFLANLVIDGRDVRVEVALSTDGGATFHPLKMFGVGAAPLGATTAAAVRASAISQDQPTVTAGHGAVWVTFKVEPLRVVATGARVSGPGRVGRFHPTEAVPNGRRRNYGDIAIGPGGRVMVTYQRPEGRQHHGKIWVNLDPDGLGPKGFGPSVFVTRTNVGGFDFLPAQPDRSVDAEAGLGWDETGGGHQGRLYLAYTDEFPDESNDFDVFVRHSDDDGLHWSARARVNDDTGTNSQFLPRIALDPTTGSVAVSWLDARNDHGSGPGDTDGVPNDEAQLWAAVSTDGGETFEPNVRVSAGTSNAATAGSSTDYGDYCGLASFGGAFYPAWADNSNSTHDNPDGRRHAFDVYTARVSVS